MNPAVLREQMGHSSAVMTARYTGEIPLKQVRRAGCGNLFFHDLRRSAVRDILRAGISQSTAMRISGHRLGSWGRSCKGVKLIQRCISESASRIQDNAASSFKKFGDLLYPISRDSQFIERFAKVLKKPIEMPVV
jgi:hypothetical protein